MVHIASLLPQFKFRNLIGILKHSQPHNPAPCNMSEHMPFPPGHISYKKRVPLSRTPPVSICDVSSPAMINGDPGDPRFQLVKAVHWGLVWAHLKSFWSLRMWLRMLIKRTGVCVHFYFLMRVRDLHHAAQWLIRKQKRDKILFHYGSSIIPRCTYV